MRPTLHLTKRAEAHLRDAHRWYESQRGGLGDRFVQAVETKLVEILEWPRSFVELEDGIRCALVDRFPYRVMFSTGRSRIVILAVHHQRRDPRTWTDSESP